MLQRSTRPSEVKEKLTSVQSDREAIAFVRTPQRSENFVFTM